MCTAYRPDVGHGALSQARRYADPECGEIVCKGPRPSHAMRSARARGSTSVAHRVVTRPPPPSRRIRRARTGRRQPRHRRCRDCATAVGEHRVAPVLPHGVHQPHSLVAPPRRVHAIAPVRIASRRPRVRRPVWGMGTRGGGGGGGGHGAIKSAPLAGRAEARRARVGKREGMGQGPRAVGGTLAGPRRSTCTAGQATRVGRKE
jgi:hypothetical protein